VTAKNSAPKMLGVVALVLLGLGLMACVTQRDFSTARDLQGLVQQKNQRYLLIDVRMPSEYVEGHIPSAVNIPLDQLETKMSAGDRSLLVVVYCQSGRRATMAKKTLDAMGYATVVNFGAISNWPWELVKGN
jgi:phage shock protein E